MSEIDRFVGLDRRGSNLVAVMLKDASFITDDGEFVMNLERAQTRLANLKDGGWAHDQTELAVAALKARETE